MNNFQLCVLISQLFVIAGIVSDKAILSIFGLIWAIISFILFLKNE